MIEENRIQWDTEYLYIYMLRLYVKTVKTIFNGIQNVYLSIYVKIISVLIFRQTQMIGGEHDSTSQLMKMRPNIGK